jgi:hypothetical protein
MRQLALLIGILGLLLSCKSDAHQQLVSRQYNFSILMPETPEVHDGVNDEGLPRTEWLVKHTHLLVTEYYSVTASCYKETLNPDDELALNDALLAANGITVVERRRFMIRARETGRAIPALRHTTKSGNSEVITDINAVDGRCLISVSTRVSPSKAGESERFLGSFELLK